MTYVSEALLAEQVLDMYTRAQCGRHAKEVKLQGRHHKIYKQVEEKLYAS